MRSLLLVLVFFMAPCARANYLMLKQPVLTTVTQASIQVLQPNTNRNSLAIYNAGPSTAFIQFGTISQYVGTVVSPGAIAYKGFPVISGQTLQWVAPAPNNGAYGDSTGTAALTIIEGQ